MTAVRLTRITAAAGLPSTSSAVLPARAAPSDTANQRITIELGLRLAVLFPVFIVSVCLLLAVLAIVAFVPRRRAAAIVLAKEPDTPKAFGDEMAWIAVRSENRERICAVLGLQDTRPANWDAGVACLYDPRLADVHVFVSPPVKGYTFIAGVPLPLPVGRTFVDKLTPLLTALGAEFTDVQYFASYPVIDFFAWARLQQGRFVRAFAIGDEGVIWDRGRLTPDERALGLKLFEVRGIRGRKGDTGEAIILHPTQAQVLRMARAWSLDPTGLDKAGCDASVGVVALAPASWRTTRVRNAA